jgi:hypothetical protein
MKIFIEITCQNCKIYAFIFWVYTYLNLCMVTFEFKNVIELIQIDHLDGMHTHINPYTNINHSDWEVTVYLPFLPYHKPHFLPILEIGMHRCYRRKKAS